MIADGFGRVRHQMSERFSQRIFVTHNGWQVRRELRLDRNSAIRPELGPCQFEAALDRRSDVERFHIQLGRMGERVDLSDDFVQSIDFLYDNGGEILSKIRIIESFRQQLGEGFNGDKRIANFV